MAQKISNKITSRMFKLVAAAVGAIMMPKTAIMQAGAAPADPFTGAFPAFDAPPPEGVNYNLGDWGVAEQKGAATYTYPIIVPPGRQNMAPSLALRYSSDSPVRGGIAAGWSLSIPTIERDYSLGTQAIQYKTTFGTISGRLVLVVDVLPSDNAVAAYRLDFDNYFTLFL